MPLPHKKNGAKILNFRDSKNQNKKQKADKQRLTHKKMNPTSTTTSSPPTPPTPTSSIAALFDQLCDPDVAQTQKKSQENTLIQLVESNQLPLNDCIKELGPYLVNTNDRIRSKSYHVLHMVICHMDEQSVMSTHPQTIASLCRFCGDRLGDFECLSDILQLISTLLSTWKHSVPEDRALFIISQYVHCLFGWLFDC